MELVDTRRIEIAANEELIKGPLAEAQIGDLVRDLLVAIGEDPEREVPRRTSERVARSMQELLAGHQVDPAALINDAIFASDYQGMVLPI